MRKERLEIKS